MKIWKVLRDGRLKSDGVHQAMRGIAHLHNLTLAGREAVTLLDRHVVDHSRENLKDVHLLLSRDMGSR